MSFPNWRLVASTVILLVVVASFFSLSFLGSVAALLAGVAVICLLWELKLYAAIVGALMIPVGLVGAVVDNPTKTKAEKVLMLTVEFHTDPVKNDLTLDEQDLAFEVIYACGLHNNRQLQNMAKDAMLAIHEPAKISWFSWAIKPTNEPSRCFLEADRLAFRSPAYKERLEAIFANGS